MKPSHNSKPVQQDKVPPAIYFSQYRNRNGEPDYAGRDAARVATMAAASAEEHAEHPPRVLFSQYRSAVRPVAAEAGPPEPAAQEIVPALEPVRMLPPAQQLHQPVQAVPQERLPLFNGATILRIAWRYRTMVFGFLIAGAVVGAGASMILPRKYSATTDIYFDPNQARTISDTEAAPTISSEVVKATVDSKLKIITSAGVMTKVVKKLNLDKDSEFIDKKAVSATDRINAAVLRLQAMTKIDRDDDTYVATVKVTTADAQKSALIANELLGAFLQEEADTALSKYTWINAALGTRIEELGKLVQQSESAVEEYKAQNDLVSASGDLIADKRLTSLNELLVTTQKATIAAKSKMDAAAHLDINNVIAGDIGDSVTSRTLGDLRSQYANLAANAGSLETKMGPRHPALLAARASMEEIRSEIRNELKRVAATAQNEYAEALKTEQGVAKELATQKALQSTSSPGLVELNELERKAKAATEIYEAALKRAKENKEEQNLLQSNIRVISTAMPALKPDGPGGKILLAAGIFGGLLFGLGLGVAVALARWLIAAAIPAARTLRDAG